MGLRRARPRRRRRALKPRLVGDRELAVDPADQSRARDLRRQRRHQARPGALLRPGRRLAAAGAAAPAGDDVSAARPATSRTASTSATPSPACRPASRPSSWPTRRSRGAFIAVTEPKGFLALTQFGAIEFHLWGCRIDDPEHPDRLVMDLDPDEALPWARVCDGAEMLRDRLEALGLRAVPAHHRRQGRCTWSWRWPAATTGRW